MSETCPHCGESVGDPDPTLADHLLEAHREKIEQALADRKRETPTERVRRRVGSPAEQ